MTAVLATTRPVPVESSAVPIPIECRTSAPVRLKGFSGFWPFALHLETYFRPTGGRR